MKAQLTSDTTAPEPVRSLKSSNVFGYTSSLLIVSTTAETGAGSSGSCSTVRLCRSAISSVRCVALADHGLAGQGRAQLVSLDRCGC